MILPDDTSKEHGYLRGLEIAMTEEPGRTCLALRLAYVPEAIQNYVPAIFDAPFLPFLLATTGGSSPTQTESRKRADRLRGGASQKKRHSHARP